MNNVLSNPVAILIVVFLCICVLWILWRAIRRIFSPRQPRQEPMVGSVVEPRQTVAASSPVPDAADVLALKNAIDNLARQVSALERRLAGDAAAPAEQPAVPAGNPEPAKPVEPTITLPDHRI